MDPITRAMMMGASGGASAPPETLYADTVFSANTYTGNNGTQTITNKVNLQENAGLVWLKGRTGGSAYTYGFLVDTLRGGSNMLFSNVNQSATGTSPAIISSFNTNGFTLDSGSGIQNSSAATYVAWTFRKAPKFFDIVTFVGNGASQRSISHSLGSAPGFIMLKSQSSNSDWICYHRSITNGYLVLNSSAQTATRTDYIYQNPTSSTFDVGYAANTNGETYTAYLFAHNAGGFGSDGLSNVVSCGSFSGNGSTQTITLGFEPQFVLLKNYTGASNYNWVVYDTARGIASPGNDSYMTVNTDSGQLTYDDIDVSSTGFTIKSNSGVSNASGFNYVYVAIAKGPQKPPEASELFAPIARTGTGAAATVTTGFQPNMAISIRRTSGEWGPVVDSNRGTNLWLSIAQSPLSQESSAYSGEWFTGFTSTGATLGADNSGGQAVNASGASIIQYYFKEHPGFFDVVTYSGSGANNGSYNSVSHSLGVTPELIIVKCRLNASPGAGGWHVYFSGINREFLYWSTNSSSSAPYFITGGNSSTFSVVNHYNTGFGGLNYVAYLFASLNGVSKVGSYTGTGSDVTVNCGFTNGARFVMIKRSDSTGSWYVWDTARGIVAGNDPYWRPDSFGAEVTSTDFIDPVSSGFIVSGSAGADLNASGGTYAYLAIA